MAQRHRRSTRGVEPRRLTRFALVRPAADNPIRLGCGAAMRQARSTIPTVAVLAEIGRACTGQNPCLVSAPHSVRASRRAWANSRVTSGSDTGAGGGESANWVMELDG